jgi:hypothetical protein
VTPDGEFVDFVRRMGREDDLWRVGFLGGTPKKLIDHVNSAIGWSPDTQHMAFVRSLDSWTSSALLVAGSPRTTSKC